MNLNIDDLWLYRKVSRLSRLGYVGKIMLVTFVGIHVPLLALIAYLVLARVPESGNDLRMVAVALIATLGGTAVTLTALHFLLKPIVLTSSGLRNYLARRELPDLPTGFRDAAGTLMADAQLAVHRLDRTIRRLEYVDEKTGLPNRAACMRHLARWIHSNASGTCSLLVLDIVNFHQIVATFGQQTADEALRILVARMEQVLPDECQLSRISDSSLACMLEGVDLPEAMERALWLLSLFRTLDTASVAIDFYGTAGLSTYPADGQSPATLLEQATMALSVASQEGVPVAFYSSSGHDAVLDRYELARDLRRALDGDELSLYYQPVIDSAAKRIVGAEALIRWNHPTRGMVPPAIFIPLAEQTGLIEEIGRWTLLSACGQIKAWRDDGILDLRVAVNLSARQFTDPKLVGYVGDMMREFDIPAGALEVELTETSAMADTEHTGSTLNEIRDLGVSVAIDDFGTGYSSMSYLRTLPFNKLKIDREFVKEVSSNPDHLAICRALIALARELNLEILAEGTETRSDVRTLREQGCHVFQGFYFSRPLKVDEFTQLLSSKNASGKAARVDLQDILDMA